MDWHKQHEQRHVEQRQQNSWRMHSHWYKHNVPQCQPRHSNHHSKHRPPAFLRLNSQGHEEFPNCSEFSERPQSSSRNQGQQQRAHSFLGSIFSKANLSFTASGATHHLANNSARGLQGQINVDTLVDKFTTDLSVEPTNKMMNQEMPRCPPRQAHPATARPSMMNFNGGPYITLTSQNNSLKTFPACYRFLNLVHFHPYSNANRYNRAMPPPFGQGRPAWSAGGTLQSRYHNKHPDFDHHTMKVPLVGHCKTPVSRPQTHCLSAHHGNKVSADMMQVGHCMSHQSSQHIKSNVDKVTSSKPLQIETKSDSFHDGSKSTATNYLPPHGDDGRQSQPCATPPTCAKDMPKRQPRPNSSSSSEQTSPDSDDAKPNLTTETQDLNVCSPCSPADANSDNVNKIDNITKCNNEMKEKDKKHEHLLDQSASESVHTSDKALHSSIAYLLGNYSAESASGSCDSDFSDADEDTLNEEINRENQELLKSFLTNDVYNPLDGWKCNGNLTSSKNQTDTVAEINNTKFNDSGVSVQTLDDVASNDDTDSSGDWSDSGCDEEDCDEEEQRLWDSLNACDDPYDPLQGWRCNNPPLQNIDERDSLAENSTKSLQQTVAQDSKNSLQQTVAHDICSTDSIQQAVARNSTDSLKQTVAIISADSLQDMVGHDDTDSTQQTLLHDRLDSTGLLQQIASNPSVPLETARHPSVSFILGGDDYDSSSDSDTDETSQLQDELWNSFEATNDPYDPINGWRYHSPSPIHKSSSSPSLLCTDKQSTCSEKTQSVLEARCALPEPEDSDCKKSSTAATGIILKCSSSTGCLMMWRSTLKVSERKPKKVTFCNREPSTIFSQQVPEWGEEEYAQARRGHWQDFARDRCRFQKRIRDAEAAIALYLTSAHRKKVFENLYSNQ